MSVIYFIVFVLFLIYVVFVWNSTKEFENTIIRVSYLLIGTLFITISILILFWISKIGVEYPKQEMIGEVRKIVLLVFIPINGFIILTQVSTIFVQAKSGMVSKEDIEKKIKRLIIIFIILIIIETIYFKSIQNGMIKFIESVQIKKRFVVNYVSEFLHRPKNEGEQNETKSYCNSGTNCIRKDSTINRAC